MSKVVSFFTDGKWPGYTRYYVLDNGEVWVTSRGEWGREALPPPCRERQLDSVTIGRETLTELCKMLLARDPLLGSDIIHPALAKARAALEEK